MDIGFTGPSYTAASSALADEECINWYLETIGSQGAQIAGKAYGGAVAHQVRGLLWTPGLSIFATLPKGPTRGQCAINGRLFAVGGDSLYEVKSDGTTALIGAVGNDGNSASLAASSIQLLVVSAGRGFCVTLATNAIVEVTGQLAGAPMQVGFSDSYFIVIFANSNKFQISNPLDGATWNGLYVNAVEVFPENLVSMIVSHRELWLFGGQHTQPYQDTGSNEIFDVVPGALLEKGAISTFATCRVDNTIFWVDLDERGSCSAWRANGYVPERISSNAVEVALQSYGAAVNSLVSYAYQDAGHLFWVLYVPGAADASWVYDVEENMWHKRGEWNSILAAYGQHWSWNHSFAFGKQIVGDWNTGNLYWLDESNLTDNGTNIRRLRRAPTVSNEMERLYHAELNVDVQTGLGPQPPLVDGNGNPRPPQAMLRWSDDRGQTWSNEHVVNCGYAGQFKTRVIWRRLGQSRYRVYEFSVSDPIAWTVVGAYLRLAAQ